MTIEPDFNRCPEELVLTTGTVVGSVRKTWRCSREVHGDSSHCADLVASSGQVFSVHWDGPTPKFSDAMHTPVSERRKLPPPKIT
jgi:hypothetical protein